MSTPFLFDHGTQLPSTMGRTQERRVQARQEGRRGVATRQGRSSREGCKHGIAVPIKPAPKPLISHRTVLLDAVRQSLGSETMGSWTPYESCHRQQRPIGLLPPLHIPAAIPAARNGVLSRPATLAATPYACCQCVTLEMRKLTLPGVTEPSRELKGSKARGKPSQQRADCAAAAYPVSRDHGSIQM
jgi:hypothetical protein